ncbi:hypothetical protein [Comamonas sp.]|uniref:hypothetical protein n=1 Tax=Comamonas sp. TaxID=34028 RepID=UPI003A917399
MVLSVKKALSGLVIWFEVSKPGVCGPVVNAGQHSGAVQRLDGAVGFVGCAVSGEACFQRAAMDCVVQHGAHGTG